MKWRIFCSWLAGMAVLVTSDKADANCPNNCLCIYNVQVLCEQSGLKHIPADLPDHTEHLSLRRNNISYVPPDAFRNWPRLRRLVLDTNHIRDVAPHAFRGLANLEELSLQDNLLPYLPTNSFAGLVNVTNLYLGYNKITTIAMNAFAHTRHIRYLSLIGNPLRTLQSGAFANLHDVEILYLPTGIREIEPDTFNGLSKVSMLRLAGMQLKVLPQYAFRGLSNVSSLTIRESNVTTVKSRAFYGLAQVDYLTLENNELETVEANALQGVHGIGVLGIHNNRIHALEPYALDDTQGHVRKVRFAHNWLPCDCHLSWVAKSHARTAPTLLNDNFCLSPEELVNRNASNVPLDALGPCGTQEPPEAEEQLNEHYIPGHPPPGHDHEHHGHREGSGSSNNGNHDHNGNNNSIGRHVPPEVGVEGPREEIELIEKPEAQPSGEMLNAGASSHAPFHRALSVAMVSYVVCALVAAS